MSMGGGYPLTSGFIFISSNREQISEGSNMDFLASVVNPGAAIVKAVVESASGGDNGGNSLEKVVSVITTASGHIMRSPRHSFEKQVIEGRMNGRRVLGRAPIRWADTVKNAVGGSEQRAVHTVLDREQWKRTRYGHDSQN
ncbi:unnamed protein product, partial [Iphiclides podalirius]